MDVTCLGSIVHDRGEVLGAGCGSGYLPWEHSA